MRTFLFSLSLCVFAAAAFVAGAALTLPAARRSAPAASSPQAAEATGEMSRMLAKIAAEQAASAALVNDLRKEIGSLQDDISLREAQASLAIKEEQMALEEENRRLLGELQETFERLRRERAEAEEKEGAARLAGEEASRAALDELRRTVEELREDLQAERAAVESGVSSPTGGGGARQPLSPAVSEATAADAAGPSPPPTEEPAEDRGKVIAILGGGLFSPGQNILTPDLERAVQKALPAIVTSPESALIVEGHTDSKPLSRKLARQFVDNRTLSLLRAQTVADILVQAGVDSGRITSVGFGDTRPIAPNVTAAGRAENRRVEIRLVPPGEPPMAKTEAPAGK